MFDEVAYRILAGSPSNMHILLIAEKNSNINYHIWKRLNDSMVKYGGRDGETLMSRVRFASYSSYGEIIARASCILDTFPYGGEHNLFYIYTFITTPLSL